MKALYTKMIVLLVILIGFSFLGLGLALGVYLTHCATQACYAGILPYIPPP